MNASVEQCHLHATDVKAEGFVVVRRVDRVLTGNTESVTGEAVKWDVVRRVGPAATAHAPVPAGETVNLRAASRDLRRACERNDAAAARAALLPWGRALLAPRRRISTENFSAMPRYGPAPR